VDVVRNSECLNEIVNASAAHLYESAAVIEFLSGARLNTTQK
jgi:hypothetical protein